MNDDRIGPAFDANTLSQFTLRKFVCMWMEDAGLPTLVLPQVQRELIRKLSVSHGFTSRDSWLSMMRQPHAPFRWQQLSKEQGLHALDIRMSFTQSCFPVVPVDRIADHIDAVAVSEALALGVDYLVTGNVKSIDHYEINYVVRQSLGDSAVSVMTLDDALMKAYPGGELAEQLLVNALAIIAPTSDTNWSVDDAYIELETLTRAMTGLKLIDTADRLMNRWEHARNLESVLEKARMASMDSQALKFERLRTQWHRDYRETDRMGKISR